MTAAAPVFGDVVTVNPADYPPAGTLLTNAVPQLTLHDADSSNAINTFFTITSYQENANSNLGPIWDFADGGVSFYNNNTRLRIDFNVPVSEVQIQFLSNSGPAKTATGTLNVYDSLGDNLGQYTTAALSTAQSEVMEVSGLPSTAAYAVATGTNGGFGRLTNLEVVTLVPEPSPLLLVLIAGTVGLLGHRSREKPRRRVIC